MKFHLIDELIKLSILAGDAIMEVYKRNDFHKQIKKDNSPLTEADLISHDCIVHGLNVINKKFNFDYPILSEESKSIAFEDRKKWSYYWLVDPLDGTKEFIKRNGEFTVNIALIENGKPIIGVVYAPVLDVLYWGDTRESISKKICGIKINEDIEKTLNPNINILNKVRIIASRSHLNEETKIVIKELQKKYEDCELLSSGSSLKLCKVAEGVADLYPRFAPTMEWDTAAADAVCRAAQCYVLSAENNEPLLYNKEQLLNPHFYVTSCNDIKIIMETINNEKISY